MADGVAVGRARLLPYLKGLGRVRAGGGNSPRAPGPGRSPMTILAAIARFPGTPERDRYITIQRYTAPYPPGVAPWGCPWDIPLGCPKALNSTAIAAPLAALKTVLRPWLGTIRPFCPGIFPGVSPAPSTASAPGDRQGRLAKLARWEDLLFGLFSVGIGVDEATGAPGQDGLTQGKGFLGLEGGGALPGGLALVAFAFGGFLLRDCHGYT